MSLKPSAAVIVWAMLVASPAAAQTTLEWLADPRPDPVIVLPVLTSQTTLRIAGILHASQVLTTDTKSVTATLIGEVPVMRARLTAFGDGELVSIDVIAELKQVASGLFAFSALCRNELIGDTPTVKSAVLTFGCDNCATDFQIQAGVYVEETSVIPAFPPYHASLAPFHGFTQGTRK